ncbi:glycoside hydrolase family 3 protein [Jatrophihabitans sp.]|uniref:glycoside hydrolase family 3 protein n=1 Tax=Jatrophihabitans sp. TaxID=1932789 RepID=UPI002B802DE4|nr:glycoside hydrolase family 3 protein [Jatrophihabitans sp.]
MAVFSSNRSHPRRAAAGAAAALLAAGLLAWTQAPAATAAAACTSPADCLSKMTLAEKAGQMTQASWDSLKSKADITTYGLGSLLSGGGGGPNGAGGTATQWKTMVDDFQSYALKSRLGIPLLYGIDAVHGNNNITGATVFPHNIGLGATRDAALVQQVEDVTRQEVLGSGIRWAFAPCLCVARDDRWGRSYESFGEDPSVGSALAGAAVTGFQGSSLSSTSVLATAKHWVGDGATTYGTGSSGYLIDQGDARISETELDAIHIPPYTQAIAAGVGSAMVSYSSWNGVKDHGNKYLITDKLKGAQHFSGFVVSDWAGVKQLPDSTYAAQVAHAVNAGIDMIMVPDIYVDTINAIVNGVNGGQIPLSRVDDAVTRILTAKFALGLFSTPYTDSSYTASVGSAAHRAVARQAVRESQVLLKNDGVLPLAKTGSYKIVVGGKSADNIGNQMGGWSISWQGASGATTTGGTTFWQALQQQVAGTGITVSNVGTRTKGNYKADIGIWVGGETPYAEGKGDSSTLAFGSDNSAALSDICARVTKCIAILESGRPVIIKDQLAKANAFVAAWLPGTEGGGLVDNLFGSGYTGKLPMSWPNAVTDEPINTGDGKTPLFAFGSGRSPY